MFLIQHALFYCHIDEVSFSYFSLAGFYVKNVESIILHLTEKKMHVFFFPLGFSTMCQSCLGFFCTSANFFSTGLMRDIFFYRLYLITFIFPLLSLSCRLQEVHFKAPLCEAKRDEVLFLDGDFSSASHFFLTVGVFSFLYSLLATIVYVFYQNKYLKNNRGPLVVSEFNPSANPPLMSQNE